MPGALRAICTTASDRHKLRVPLVERCILEQEQDVRIVPELQTADRQRDSRWLVAVCHKDLFEAGFERGLRFLRKTGEQVGMIHGYALGGECLRNGGNEL